MSNQIEDKWADYAPNNAVEAYIYANTVFWFDDNGDIIYQDSDIDTFNQWVEETGEQQ